jgi:UTP-glucose-1-phosphate uridylyltransferase
VNFAEFKELKKQEAGKYGEIFFTKALKKILADVLARNSAHTHSN